MSTSSWLRRMSSAAAEGNTDLQHSQALLVFLVRSGTPQYAIIWP